MFSQHGLETVEFQDALFNTVRFSDTDSDLGYYLGRIVSKLGCSVRFDLDFACIY